MPNGNRLISGSFQLAFHRQKAFTVFGWEYAKCYAKIGVNGRLEAPRLTGPLTYQIDFKLETQCDTVLKAFDASYQKTFKSDRTTLVEDEPDYTATLLSCGLPGAELVTAAQISPIVSFQSALAAVEKKVTILVNPEDLKELKQADYKLCFAKKVGNNAYNVVWQSFSKYLFNNEFSWTPQYQLFGSNIFQSGIDVVVSTNVVKIGLGEESVLDPSGVLEQPTTGGSTTGFTLNNKYGSIHPGVNQLSSNSINGHTVSTPIYVASSPVVQGETVLTPVEKVLVWFEQDVETSTMFSTSRSNSVEIDLTTQNSATRLYKDQQWSTPS